MTEAENRCFFTRQISAVTGFMDKNEFESKFKLRPIPNKPRENISIAKSEAFPSRQLPVQS